MSSSARALASRSPGCVGALAGYLSRLRRLQAICSTPQLSSAASSHGFINVGRSRHTSTNLSTPALWPPVLSGPSMEGVMHATAAGSTRPLRIGQAQALLSSPSCADMSCASTNARGSTLPLRMSRSRGPGMRQDSSSSALLHHLPLEHCGSPLELLDRPQSHDAIVHVRRCGVSVSRARSVCARSLHHSVHSSRAAAAEAEPSQAQTKRAPTEGSGKEAKANEGAKGPPRIMLVNTMTGAKEELVPKQEGKVGMYVCGVTVYDYSHIGHARVYVSFDAIYRYLQAIGYDVTYVRNFTDVDDKILRRAAETGEDPLHLSARFIREFHIDMELLNCLAPTHEPKVSDHIPDIIDMISSIIERGHAYAVEGGDVFFSVPSSSGYGQLSGRKLEENRAGERVEVDGRKKHPADFALWKSTKPGEGVAWDSPWGMGRPGWHIECSAMSARYLGFQFDIHGGGQDLVFPHHENELAQSQAACPDCHVASWVHNGFVTIDSEKMSKSTGNFFTIREVLKKYHPMALRWFLLNTHYRSPINFSPRQLAVASDRVFYVYQVLSSSHAALSRAESDAEEAAESGSQDGAALSRKAKGPPKASKAALAAAAGIEREAWAALAEDFHTGQALAALSEALRLLSDASAPKKKKAVVDTASISAVLEPVTRLLQVLGFPTDQEYCNKMLEELRALALVRAGLSEGDLNARLKERLEARKAKDFARSDAIRNELEAVGVLLMDGPEGQSWCPSAEGSLKGEEDAAVSEKSKVVV